MLCLFSNGRNDDDNRKQFWLYTLRLAIQAQGNGYIITHNIILEMHSTKTRPMISMSKFHPILLLLAWAAAGCRGERVTLKLIDGSSPNEGSIYVKRGSDWGLVCDDDWSIEAGNVVCRQLGYAGAHEITSFNLFRSSFNENIFLDDVKCLGHESNLGECKHREWLASNCHPGEAAGVICQGQVSRHQGETAVQIARATNSETVENYPELPEMTATPVTARILQEPEIPAGPGRAGLTVVSEPEMPVGTVMYAEMPEPSYVRQPVVSDSGYSKRTRHILERANRILDRNRDAVPVQPYNPADVRSQDIPSYNRERYNSLTTTATTTTEEPFRVDQADIEKIDRMIDHMKSDQPYKAPKPVRIEVAGGRLRSEGYVKVTMDDGTSGAICSDSWSIYEARVVCQQTIGQLADRATKVDFYRASRLDKVLYEVRCDGYERSFLDCEYKVGDRHGIKCSQPENVAGVVCTSAKLPDLIPNIWELSTSIHIQSKPLSSLTCAMEEGCLSSSARTARAGMSISTSRFSSFSSYGFGGPTRQLLRFSSNIFNNGTADFKPHQHRTSWEWHSCHQHYHSMSSFSHYDIVDSHGNRVAEGHKASFCLEDVQCNWPATKKYSCRGYSEQGISVGCADIYRHDIDCQWIDITDLKAGAYMFKLNVNPERSVPELSYDNNAAICELTYNGYSAKLSNCVLSRG